MRAAHRSGTRYAITTMYLGLSKPGRLAHYGHRCKGPVVQLEDGCDQKRGAKPPRPHCFHRIRVELQLREGTLCTESHSCTRETVHSSMPQEQCLVLRPVMRR